MCESATFGTSALLTVQTEKVFDFQYVLNIPGKKSHVQTNTGLNNDNKYLNTHDVFITFELNTIRDKTCKKNVEILRKLVVEAYPVRSFAH